MAIKGKEQLNEKYQNHHSKETQKNTNKILPIWSMFSIESMPDVSKSRPSSKIQPRIPEERRKGTTIEVQKEVSKNKKQQNQIQDSKQVPILSHVDLSFLVIGLNWIS